MTSNLCAVVITHRHQSRAGPEGSSLLAQHCGAEPTPGVRQRATCSSQCTCSAKRRRARQIRVFTVLTDSPVRAAISLYERPSYTNISIAVR